MLPAEARWPPRKTAWQSTVKNVGMERERDQCSIQKPCRNRPDPTPPPQPLTWLGLWNLRLQVTFLVWIPVTTRQKSLSPTCWWNPPVVESWADTAVSPPHLHLIISGLHGSLLLQLSDSPLSWYLYKTSTEDSNVSKATGQMWWIIVIRGRLPAPQWF